MSQNNCKGDNLSKKNQASLLSIAICTYNRVDQLANLFDCLRQSEEWISRNAEVLVVDNGSTDQTADYLRNLDVKFDLRYLSEPKLGLANARNRALKEFSGDGVVFFDDDISVEKKTLETYFNALIKNKDFGFFGGPISVAWKEGKPAWLKSDNLALLNGLFGKYDLGQHEQEYDRNSLMPYGANFMLQEKLVRKLGLFNTNLGLSGDNIDRGEETDYFLRAVNLGFKGQYLPEARVNHHFQIERINTVYLYRYGIAKGKAAVRVDGVDQKNSYLYSSLLYAIKAVFQLLKMRRDRYYQCVINMGICRGIFIESM